MAKILIVEDERDLALAIAEWLEDEHHLVEIAGDGETAISKLTASHYDLAILDWMLPGISGVEVCKSVRQSGGAAPILMLTARASLSEKEAGLDAGADDYLTKPFQLRELSARVRALLRRPSSMPVLTFNLGEIELDRHRCKVTRAGVELHLLPKEFALLEVFMRNAGRVLSISELLDRVWGSDSDVVPDTVRSTIRTLRNKIDMPGQPSLLKTVHGMGYKVEPQ